MRWSWIAAGLVSTLACAYAVLSSCTSFRQKPGTVFRRLPGGTLHCWKTVAEAAEMHWPYAWASVAAYQDADDPKRKPLETNLTYPEPHHFLSENGWEQWKELPSLKSRAVCASPTDATQGTCDLYPESAQRMRAVHLRAEVWSNIESKRVIVAFGGTAASSWNDWKSNLRWMHPINTFDEYTVVTDTFVPVFVQAYEAREKTPEGAWLNGASVIATGHSLGGGLAQRLAYSLLKKGVVPPIKEVYAFDPSPVSGKRSAREYATQAVGMTIYRIYNRGEILASLRSIANATNPGDWRNQGQSWIDIRYLDDWSWKTLMPSGSVHAHSM
jgi:hypothetical protein